MKEEGLWQNQNHWILSWVKKPGIISHKENLMEKSKEIGQNQSKLPQDQSIQARQLKPENFYDRETRIPFHNSFDKEIETWQCH